MQIPRVAQLMALAIRLEELIAAGHVPSYAGLARLVGVSRARLTQIANLTLLAPDIQEAIHRPVEDWGKLLGDVPTATAILDRFLHHAEIITVTGKSYRLRHRGEASKPAKAPTGSKKNEKGSKPAKAPTGSRAEKEKQKIQKVSANQPTEL